MHSEYARQRQHLERSVASLRKKLTKDTEIHRADTIRVMQVGGRGRREREGREGGREGERESIRKYCAISHTFTGECDSPEGDQRSSQ